MDISIKQRTTSFRIYSSYMKSSLPNLDYRYHIFFQPFKNPALLLSGLLKWYFHCSYFNLNSSYRIKYINQNIHLIFQRFGYCYFGFCLASSDCTAATAAAAPMN